jgi:hypothetical protein
MSYKYKCSQVVKKAPLELFKIERHGRKWKQSARSLKGYILHLSLSANGDGTFVGKKGINFSPSYEALCETFAESSLRVYEDEARELGIVSWTRTNHYNRREYVIHLSKLITEEHPQDSRDDEQKHPQDSSESPAGFDEVDEKSPAGFTKTPAATEKNTRSYHYLSVFSVKKPVHHQPVRRENLGGGGGSFCRQRLWNSQLRGNRPSHGRSPRAGM